MANNIIKYYSLDKWDAIVIQIYSDLGLTLSVDADSWHSSEGIFAFHSFCDRVSGFAIQMADVDENPQLCIVRAQASNGGKYFHVSFDMPLDTSIYFAAMIGDKIVNNDIEIPAYTCEVLIRAADRLVILEAYGGAIDENVSQLESVHSVPVEDDMNTYDPSDDILTYDPDDSFEVPEEDDHTSTVESVREDVPQKTDSTFVSEPVAGETTQVRSPGLLSRQNDTDKDQEIERLRKVISQLADRELQTVTGVQEAELNALIQKVNEHRETVKRKRRDYQTMQEELSKLQAESGKLRDDNNDIMAQISKAEDLRASLSQETSAQEVHLRELLDELGMDRQTFEAYRGEKGVQDMLIELDRIKQDFDNRLKVLIEHRQVLIKARFDRITT